MTIFDVIEKLLKGKITENEYLECKKALGADGKGALPRDFWKTYSAFANTKGGTVLLGIREKSGKFHLEGIPNADKVVKELFTTINNKKKVSINLLTPQHVHVIDYDGHNIIAINIPQATYKQRPVFLNDNPMQNTYCRLHEGDMVCDEQTIKRMLAEQSVEIYDQRILKHFGMNDINIESLRIYRQALRDVKPSHPWLELDDKEFLKRFKGWRRDRETGDEGLTVAGLLMFGQWESINEHFPNYWVDYQERPEAKLEHRWIDRVHPDGTWSGNLYDFYRKVYRKLIENLKIPFSLDKGQRQDDPPAHQAIREALVNTLVHADYSQHSHIIVVKRPDLFVFRNPGDMRISLQQAREGGHSDCRNPSIHNMFTFIGLGEKAGSGIPKIFKGWQDQYLSPPHLEVNNRKTTLVLNRIELIPQDVLDKLQLTLGNKWPTLTKVEQVILAHTAMHHAINHGQLKTLTIGHAHDLTITLGNLVKRKLLESHGQGRGTTYSLPGEKIITPEHVFVDYTDAYPEDSTASLGDLTASLGDLTASLGDLTASLGDSKKTTKHTSTKTFTKNKTTSLGDLNVSQDKSKPLPKDKRDTNGCLIVQDLDGVIIDSLEKLNKEFLKELETKSAHAKNSSKLASHIMEGLILDVCTNHYVTLPVLSKLLDRRTDTLRKSYLKSLVDRRWLKMAFPTTPTSPKQAYINILPEFPLFSSKPEKDHDTRE